MKQLIFLLLIHFYTFAQNDKTISVVSAERLNVVYRGVHNPLKIAVPGAKSFTANAPGLIKIDSIGNYKLTPGAGKEVVVAIKAVLENGSILHEEKVFRIKGLPAPSSTLYGKDGYVVLTKQELIDATVKIELEDFLFDVEFTVYRFKLILPNKELIEVEGSKMNAEAIAAIKKLKNKQEVIIDSIQYIKNPDPRVEYRHLLPIVVSIKKG